jgi:carboxylesterase
MGTEGAPAGYLEDFSAIGNGATKEIGILLVHGFTGSPSSMRPWAEFMHQQGYTVRVPLLPGHGTKPEDLNQVKWQEWPRKVESELRELQKTCTKIFVFGLSMGGGLTLYTTENHQQKIDGIVLVNPMIHIPMVTPTMAKVLSTFQKMRSAVGNDIKRKNVTEYAYDANPLVGIYELTKMLKITRAKLIEVSIPTLLFHSTDDHVLPVSNTEIILKGISSTDRERVELTNSYHVATLDHDMEIIFEKSLTFVQARS